MKREPGAENWLMCKSNKETRDDRYLLTHLLVGTAFLGNYEQAQFGVVEGTRRGYRV